MPLRIGTLVGEICYNPFLHQPPLSRLHPRLRSPRFSSRIRFRPPFRAKRTGKLRIVALITALGMDTAKSRVTESNQTGDLAKQTHPGFGSPGTLSGPLLSVRPIKLVHWPGGSRGLGFRRGAALRVARGAWSVAVTAYSIAVIAWSIAVIRPIAVAVTAIVIRSPPAPVPIAHIAHALAQREIARCGGEIAHGHRRCRC